jgi:hypothetical protein
MRREGKGREREGERRGNVISV